MGKYMRKANITSDKAVTDLPNSSTSLCNTVCTRAKTLALQQPPNCANTSESSSYLQLRSRRLERSNISGAVKLKKSSAAAEESFTRRNTHSNPRIRNVKSGSISCSTNEMGYKKDAQEDHTGLNVEGSCGNDDLLLQQGERSTRESTPFNLIRDSDIIATPGSITRPAGLIASNRKSRNSMQQIPTTCEMEDFFAFAEQEQQRLFSDKYNFDVVNDVPLPGRYEWVSVYP